MDYIKGKISDFLKKYGMYYGDIDIEENCKAFIKDMEDGLDGKSGSLFMIPTYITMDKDIPVDEPVIVMDAGGTNFRVAVVHFDRDKKPVISDYKIYPMPGTGGEISREDFFDAITGCMEPIINKSKKIGFCFSYEAEVSPN
jgi:hexokinase